MKSLLSLSLFISLHAVATPALEAQKRHIDSIIAKNQQDINQALEILRMDQRTLRRSTNALAVIEGIVQSCADSDFERLITSLKKNWEYDFVKMTSWRLESSYRMYINNPELEPHLKISASEVFNINARLETARNIKICNYEELFDFDESADFVYAREGAWQNYHAVLSYNDIVSSKYQRTLKHIVAKAPIKVKREIKRIGSPSASYRFGRVNQLITFDKVFSGGLSFQHAKLTNPIEIIKQAKKY